MLQVAVVAKQNTKHDGVLRQMNTVVPSDPQYVYMYIHQSGSYEQFLMTNTFSMSNVPSLPQS